MDARHQRFLDGLERVHERRARPKQFGDNYLDQALGAQQQQDPISLTIAVMGAIGTAAPFTSALGVTLFTTGLSIAGAVAVGAAVNYSSTALMGVPE